MILAFDQDVPGPLDSPLHVRLGDMSVSLTSDLQEAMEDFAPVVDALSGR